MRSEKWLPRTCGCPPPSIPTIPSASSTNIGIVARLKAGVTVAQARAEMTVIAQRLERAYPASNTGWGVTLFPMAEMYTGRIRPVLLILLGAVGLLLLIACANLANLLLARAATREREIAIRGALGAGRRRILRQLLTESLVLSCGGGALGLVLAVWGVRAMRSAVPDMFPMLQHMRLDMPVLAFTFGISMLTGLLFGLVPAWRSSRTDLNTTLKEAAGRSESAGGSQRIRSFLLASEVAFAVLLSISAGLLLRSFVRVTEIDPGVRTANILTLKISLPETKYNTPRKRSDFYKNLMDRLEALPGVRSAGAVMILPLRVSILSFRIGVNGFDIEGRPPVAKDKQPLADYRTATPGYFNTMGIALRQGRLFDRHDDQDAKHVVIVNEAMVRKHFPHENPLGQHILMGERLEIVGVVADAKLYGLDAPIEPAVYVPLMQNPGVFREAIVVRTEGDPAAMAPTVRREILKLDPAQPASNVRTMQQVLSDSLMLRRVSMLLLTVFASLALTLATVGIYGLTAYAVSRRTHEIGLRVALGASQPQILRLVVWPRNAHFADRRGHGHGRRFRADARSVGDALRRHRHRPSVFAGVPLLLVGVSVLASYIPARKAMRIDPLAALKVSVETDMILRPRRAF